jgi:hypothetical protein
VASGHALIETGWRPDDYDAFEDMRYTTAVHAASLAPDSSNQVDLPDAEIVIRVPRHID